MYVCIIIFTRFVHILSVHFRSTVLMCSSMCNVKLSDSNSKQYKYVQIINNVNQTII